MLVWISQHQAVLAVVINFGTLLIWFIYAQLLYSGFRRQRRPRPMINRGKRKDIEAICIISNMSAESLFIEHIIAELQTSHGTIIMDVTDLDQEYEFSDVKDEGKPEERNERRALASSDMPRVNTRQGPLESGGFLHICTFDEIIKRLAHDQGIEMEGHRPTGDLEFQRLTIRLIAIYGPEDMPIGAERSFDLESSDHTYELIPASWDTRRLVSMGQRRRMRKLMYRYNETNFLTSSSFRRTEKEE